MMRTPWDGKAATSNAAVGWCAVVAIWLAAIATGFALLVNYELKPGKASQSVVEWPSESRLALAPRGSTLVMFLHPECPCSRASLDELERIVQRCATPIKTYVVLTGPGEFETLAHSSNGRRAARIAGVELQEDCGSADARRFGSKTSGELFVFDASGQLRFAGGITAARGHAGENAASAAAERSISADGESITRMPVFGCPLFGRADEGMSATRDTSASLR